MFQYPTRPAFIHRRRVRFIEAQLGDDSGPSWSAPTSDRLDSLKPEGCSDSVRLDVHKTWERMCCNVIGRDGLALRVPQVGINSIFKHRPSKPTIRLIDWDKVCPSGICLSI